MVFVIVSIAKGISLYGDFMKYKFIFLFEKQFQIELNLLNCFIDFVNEISKNALSILAFMKLFTNTLFHYPYYLCSEI